MTGDHKFTLYAAWRNDAEARPQGGRAAMTAPDYKHGRDIDDGAFLSAVSIRGLHKDGTGWALVWDIASHLAGSGIQDSRGEWVGVPRKVVLSKARALIKRGLLDGCTCGCRGDFELTPAGMRLLADLRADPSWEPQQ